MKHVRSIWMMALLLWSAGVSAGTVEIRGQIHINEGIMPPTVQLLSLADERWHEAAVVEADGSFVLQFAINRPGLYNLRFGRAAQELILTPAEPVVRFEVDQSNESFSNIKILNSPENDAYNRFYNKTTNWDKKLNEHFVQCSGDDTCEQKLHKLLESYAAELRALQSTYKNTYTATRLCAMKMPTIAADVKQSANKLRSGYFSHVAFADSATVCTPIYREMISAYVNFLIEPSYSKEQEFLNYLTTQAAANPYVLTKTAVTLFDELYRLPREKMLGMFISWYMDNQTKLNDPVLDMKVKAITKVMPGKQYTDMTATDSAGHKVSLKEVLDKSKCTMLLFWSSECSHCREEMPLIKELYQRYHAKGLNIYAVSVDYDPNKWKNYMKEEQLEWTNVCLHETDNPNGAMDYVIMTTPTAILIDKSGLILHRFNPKGKLEKHIQEALN